MQRTPRKDAVVAENKVLDYFYKLSDEDNVSELSILADNSEDDWEMISYESESDLDED